MKFQEVQNKFKNKWTYQAQFHDAKDVNQAVAWLSPRFKGEMLVEQASIFLNDLQSIYELRIQFDHRLKIIRRVQSRKS